MVLRFKWSIQKHCVAKVLQAIWEITVFLYEINCNCDSYKSRCKFAFILFWSFHGIQKQESNFQQVDDLITRNNSPFCLSQVLLFFKDILNSIGFDKGIFLHVILVRIIALWQNLTWHYKESQKKFCLFIVSVLPGKGS